MVLVRCIETAGLRQLSEKGPYWFGEDLSLLDLTFYPHFERLPAWAHYRGINIPEDCTRLKAWVEAMAHRSTVQSVANPASYYIDTYRGYASKILAA
jgi:glutathione S-transferase